MSLQLFLLPCVSAAASLWGVLRLLEAVISSEVAFPHKPGDLCGNLITVSVIHHGLVSDLHGLFYTSVVHMFTEIL